MLYIKYKTVQEMKETSKYKFRKYYRYEARFEL
jgi:hypothetical protein